MALETYANQFVTSLAGNGGSITNSQTTINIASGTGAPSGQSRFVIDSEIIVGSISGTVLTATIRGAEGTTRNTHTDGTAVSCVLTAASLLASPGVLTTKGDIVAADSSGAPNRLGVGSNGQALVADSTQTLGVKWGSAGASLGTPALTLGTSNAPGSNTTAIGTDATIAAFDATVPVTQALGDAAATGSAATAARRDHKHAITNPMTTKGDILAGGTSGAATRLAVGTDTYVLTADSTQTLGVKWAAGGSGGTAIASGSLLARTAYNPGTLATYTRSAQTYADVDTSNLSVTFTAPSSGKVGVLLSAVGKAAVAGDQWWRLAGGGISETTAALLQTSTNPERVTARLAVTGLTGGSSYTLTWQFLSDTAANTVTMYAGGPDGASGATGYGPAVMEVYDATLGGGVTTSSLSYAKSTITNANKSTASSSFVELDSSLRVTLTVPNSGSVLVRQSAVFSVANSGHDAHLGVQVDGTGSTTETGSYNQAAGSNPTETVVGETLLTGLTPGSHTFYMMYKADGTNTVTCSAGSFGGVQNGTWQSAQTIDVGVGNMINPMTTVGDVIVGGVSGAAARLAVGSNGTTLSVASGTPAWVSEAGRILAYVEYNPANGGSAVNKTTSSTTFSAVDSTNLTVTFTAPSSGNVLVTVNGSVQGVTGAANLQSALGVHGGAIVGSTIQNMIALSSSIRSTCYMKLTGLTPGTSYQYDWLFATGASGQTVTIYYGGTGSTTGNNNQAGPAIMKVEAL